MKLSDLLSDIPVLKAQGDLDKEITGVRSKYKVLDEKVSELFGKDAKNMGELISRIGRMKKAEVEFFDANEKVSRELNHGNLLYIYMVNKIEQIW